MTKSELQQSLLDKFGGKMVEEVDYFLVTDAPTVRKIAGYIWGISQESGWTVTERSATNMIFDCGLSIAWNVFGEEKAEIIVRDQDKFAEV